MHLAKICILGLKIVSRLTKTQIALWDYDLDIQGQQTLVNHKECFNFAPFSGSLAACEPVVQK